MPYTVTFRTLVKSMAPPKPQIQGDECPHASARNVMLCIGNAAFNVENAGRWHYKCDEISCQAEPQRWLSPQLDAHRLCDLAITLNADLSHADRVLQYTVASMKAEVATESMDFELDLRNFLFELLRDSVRASGSMRSWALIWTQYDRDPTPFLYSTEDTPPGPTMHTFALSEIPSRIEMGDCNRFEYWDVVTGDWIEIGNWVTFPRRAGEILCLKTANIMGCKGLPEVQEYHRAIFQRLVSDLALLPRNTFTVVD